MSRSSLPFDVVALDAMGVLYRSADDVADLLVPYVRAKGSGVPAEQIERLYTECSLGRITSGELWQRLGITDADDEEYCRRHELTYGLLPLLDELGVRGVKLACLSNDVSSWSVRLRRRFDLELRIPTWVISGDLGVRKPDARAYTALCEAVGASDPSRVVFVDDRPANVRAAAACGMRTVLFGPQPESVAGTGLRTARDMPELSGVLAMCT